MTTHIEELNPGLKDLGRYEYGWADSDTAGATAKRGLGEDVVRDISSRKSEPQWMLDLRLKSLKLFDKKPMPAWGSDLTGIDFQNIKYFVKSTEKQAATWDDLPEDIKNTYDRLGIPEAAPTTTTTTTTQTPHDTPGTPAGTRTPRTSTTRTSTDTLTHVKEGSS